MSKLLIAGAGGHGKIVAEAAQAMQCWESLAFLDDHIEISSRILSWPVIGRFDDAAQYLEEYSEIIVALGDGKLRLELLARYASQGFDLPVIIQPGAWVSPSARIGPGTVVLANAVINAAANLGRGCIINTAATVDHDCILDEGVHICPGVHLGGSVTIGRLCWIGIGSSIINNVHIGSGVMVGAGAVVISNVSSEQVVAGIPAKPFS